MQQHFSLILYGLDIKTRQKLSVLSTTALVQENSDSYKTGMDFFPLQKPMWKGNLCLNLVFYFIYFPFLITCILACRLCEMIIWFSSGIIHWLLIDLELYWNVIKQLSLLIIVILLEMLLKFTLSPFHSFIPTNFMCLFHLKNELIYCFWQHCGSQTENSIHVCLSLRPW